MSRRPVSWPVWSLAVPFALWLVAFAWRSKLLAAPPTADEAMYYWISLHWGHQPPNFTSVYGLQLGFAPTMPWHRPLFYVLYAIPARFGWVGFHAGIAAFTSLLAPLGYALLRVRGSSRPASILAGFAMALLPPLVFWGPVGLMDASVAVFLVAAWIAHARQAWRWLFVATVAAVLTKEFAMFPLGALLVVETVRDLRAKQASLWPLRLGPAATALAWGLALSLFPLMVVAMLDGVLSGGPADTPPLELLDRLTVTPYLLVLLAAGALLPRSRWMALTGLGFVAFFVTMTAVGWSWVIWYQVPPLVFSTLGVAASCDAIARWAWDRRGAVRWAGLAPAAVALLLVGAAVALPRGEDRDRLSPFTDDGGNNLPETVRFATKERDADLVRVLAAIPLDEHPNVVVFDVFGPLLFKDVIQKANHVYGDSAGIRANLPVDLRPLGEAMEANHTYTLVLSALDVPLVHSIHAVYGDCLVLSDGNFRVYHTSACPGRWQQLRQQ